MSTELILSLLIGERDRMNRAIEALEAVEGRRRRGRQPATVPIAGNTAKRRGRMFTAAQRKAQAEKMRAYWAAKRKGNR